MFHKGLNNEIIVESAKEMIENYGDTALNHIVADYSNTAIAGMEIAKKIDLLAYAIAQGMMIKLSRKSEQTSPSQSGKINR